MNLKTQGIITNNKSITDNKIYAMHWDNNTKLLLFLQPLQNAFSDNRKLQSVFTAQLQSKGDKAT
jgi:hypothetical protein